MNPKPLSPLNHLTVPVVIGHSLHSWPDSNPRFAWPCGTCAAEGTARVLQRTLPSSGRLAGAWSTGAWLPPHRPEGGAVGKGDLAGYLEAVAEIQALVAEAGGLEVGGCSVAVAALEHLAQESGTEPLGLPLRPGPQEEEVGVRLGRVVGVHQLEGAQQALGRLLGGFDEPADIFFGLLTGRLTPRRDPDGAGGGDGIGGVELVVRVVDVDDQLEADGQQLAPAP